MHGPSEKLYLDKFMTLPTLPNRSSHNNYSDPCIANLEHTGIQTSFVPRVEATIMPNGTMNRKSILAALNESRDANRNLIEVASKKPTYQQTYKSSIDKKLLQLEESRLSKHRVYSSKLKETLSQTDRINNETIEDDLLSENNSIREKYKQNYKASHVPMGRPKKVFNKESLLSYLIETVGTNDHINENIQDNNDNNQSRKNTPAQNIRSQSSSLNKSNTSLKDRRDSTSSSSSKSIRRYGMLTPHTLTKDVPATNEQLYEDEWDEASVGSYTEKSQKSEEQSLKSRDSRTRRKPKGKSLVDSEK